MAKDNTLVWLLLGVGGYLLYKKVVKPDIVIPARLNQYVQHMQAVIEGVKLTPSKLTFDIKIENPNPNPMLIDSVVGEIWVISNDGKTNFNVGNVAQYPKVTIQPNANTDVSVSIGLKVPTLIAYIVMLLQGTLKNQFLQFRGTVNANNQDWPITENYQLA
jgi:LEA14-like dessication related protein